MPVRIVRRIVVRGLDAAIDRGRRSRLGPVRLLSRAVDVGRKAVGLDRAPLGIPLPDWPTRVPDPPMWDSERERLAKWYEQMGYGTLGPGGIPVRDSAAGAPAGEGASETAADGAAEPGSAGAREPSSGREPSGGRRRNEEPASEAPGSSGSRRLPVVGHPEVSPFEGAAAPAAAAEPVAGGRRLEGTELVEAVRQVLDDCRPLVQADGGDIEFLDVRDDVVHLRLSGNCVGCPSARATLRQGIERRLRAALPQIRGIEAPQLGAAP